MSDYISRADAIGAVRYLIYDRQEKGAKPFKWWFIKQRLNAIPSAELPKGDLISRADAICEVLVNDGIDNIVDRINALPSADAVDVNEVTIHYKPYPSADAEQGEWLHNVFYSGNEYKCSVCGETFKFLMGVNYCPNCGARMYKGGGE